MSQQQRIQLSATAGVRKDSPLPVCGSPPFIARIAVGKDTGKFSLEDYFFPFVVSPVV